jgi:hypothetical protein
MQNKIKEVQNYFKHKILREEFIIIKRDYCRTHIMVDNEYMFTIWTGTICIPETTGIYEHDLSFMDLQFTHDESVCLNIILVSMLTNDAQCII